MIGLFVNHVHAIVLLLLLISGQETFRVNKTPEHLQQDVHGRDTMRLASYLAARQKTPGPKRSKPLEALQSFAMSLLALNPAFSFSVVSRFRLPKAPARAPLTRRSSQREQRDGRGFTSLHQAAWRGEADKVASLVGAGASVNERLWCGGTALHLAAAANAVSSAEILIGAGAQQYRDGEGQLPLHAAASAGADSCLDLLIRAGAEVDALDGFGFSPFRWACLNGHAQTALKLFGHGADGSRALAGLTPLALASAAGHTGVVHALLKAGILDDKKDSGASCVPALGIAREMGRDNVVNILESFASREGDLQHWELENVRQEVVVEEHRPAEQERDGQAPTIEPGRVVQEISADAFSLNRSYWDNAFVTSTPLLVRGIGKRLADDISAQTAIDLRQRWGSQNVTVFFSPDEQFQRPVSQSKGSMRYMQTDVRQMPFSEYVDLLPTYGQKEFFAIQSQQPLDEFDGLPDMPPVLKPLISEAVRTECEVQRAHHQGEYYRYSPQPLRSNLWVCSPPKVSRLHFDGDDSVLVQLSGTKRFILVAPEPLQGLTAYPSILSVDKVNRVAPGVFQEQDIGRTLENFPLVDASSPDFEQHPLFRHAQVTRIEVHEGDALLLPAFWYHQVSSSCAKDKLNVAINYWFGYDGGVSRRDSEVSTAKSDSAVPLSRLYRLLRQRLK